MLVNVIARFLDLRSSVAEEVLYVNGKELRNEISLLGSGRTENKIMFDTVKAKLKIVSSVKLRGDH